MPVNVRVLLAVSVLPFAIVSVLPAAGAVIVTLFTVVAVAAPMFGVTSVGLVANTSAPEPVSSVTAAARFADVGVARNVDTPVARPLTPVLIGSPVQFVRVPDVGVPSKGVTSVGLVANTSAPVPVSSLITPASSELDVAANTFSLSFVKAAVPVFAGSVTVFEPAAAGTAIVTVPDVEPAKTKFLPAASRMCSDDVHASVASTQLNVLSVVPFSVIPPPSAVTSEGDETRPSTIFLSSISSVSALIVTVVPFTARLPCTTRFLGVSDVPTLTSPVNVAPASGA